MTQGSPPVKPAAAPWAPYVLRRPPRIERVQMRSGRIAVTHWGSGKRAPVIMLHGMLDCAASYQFLVDCLPDDWDLMAVDWRGYGHSDDRPDLYWVPDNLADLEVLLDKFSPDEPGRVIGHSLGGTVAAAYAGVRPERLSWVINIEGFSRTARAPLAAPERIGQWLDELRRVDAPRRYATLAELAVRIARRHPRLPLERAHYLAWAWTREVQGGYEIAADPKHRLMQPLRLQGQELEECWSRIRCPMLLLLGAESEFLTRIGGDAQLQRWRALVPQMEIGSIAGAGHMIPHEQPQRLADEIMRFVRARV
jgi:pimeloyl-ACP methyl ester carboxylesterase